MDMTAHFKTNVLKEKKGNLYCGVVAVAEVLAEAHREGPCGGGFAGVQ